VLRCLDHPNLPLPDWQNFKMEGQSPWIEQVMDRSEARLPDWFMPLARGVVIPSDALFHEVGYRQGTRRPPGWIETSAGFYQWLISPGQILVVRRCDPARLWTVERWVTDAKYEVDQVLVHNVGWTPVFTRSHQSAMRLANYCHENGPPTDFSWVLGMPDDPTYAMAVARQRQVVEANYSNSSAQHMG
jgi:hypothetical protein